MTTKLYKYKCPKCNNPHLKWGLGYTRKMKHNGVELSRPYYMPFYDLHCSKCHTSYKKKEILEVQRWLQVMFDLNNDMNVLDHDKCEATEVFLNTENLNEKE